MKPSPLLVALLALGAIGPLVAQDSLPRRLTHRETGCDTLTRASTDSVYQADAVDRPVEPTRLQIRDLPFRAREVITGRSVLSFIVESSGRIDRCSVELLEEAAPEWTAVVLKELRHARYEPARLRGHPVRQRVYQVFTYHNDGRLLHGR
ncbi:MAG TPA: hypothetical protein VH680_14160 [Gemmatimonadales bacterium]